MFRIVAEQSILILGLKCNKEFKLKHLQKINHHKNYDNLKEDKNSTSILPCNFLHAFLEPFRKIDMMIFAKILMKLCFSSSYYSTHNLYKLHSQNPFYRFSSTEY